MNFTINKRTDFNNNKFNFNKFDNAYNTNKKSDENEDENEKELKKENDIENGIKNNNENIKDISARKITKLFRKFISLKRISQQKLYKDITYIPSSEYIIGLDNNQLDVNLAPEDKCIYLGTKFQDKKDGLGLELFNTTKAKYFGIFSNGRRTSAGKFTIKNKDKEYIYKGYVFGLYAYGYGRLIDKKEKKEYEGMWERSMKNGYGIEKYSDKSIYKGCFKNGKKDGIGFYQWKDNSSYEGEWKENKLNGFGIYKFSDGSYYKGEWKRSRFHGYGEFIYPGLKKYIGFFQKDKRFGFGIEIWLKEQKTFIGFWKNNNIDGYGKLIVNDKKRYGIYQQGKIIEKFKKKDFLAKIKKEHKNYLNLFKFDDYESVINYFEAKEKEQENEEEESQEEY